MLPIACGGADEAVPRDQATADAEEPANDAVTIEYIAHACFRLTSPGGQRLVIDPYASRVWIGYDFPDELDADAVLISHPHYDHDAGTARGLEFPWPAEVPVWRDPGRYELGDFVITGVAGKHADPYGKEFGQINTIWVIEVAGLRLVHVGDNGPIAEGAAAALGAVDLLMLPIDADNHILAETEIAAIRARLTPRLLVPMHYRLADLEPSVDKPDDLGDIDGWLRAHADERLRRLDTNRLVLAPEDLPEVAQILVFGHSPDVPSAAADR